MKSSRHDPDQEPTHPGHGGTRTHDLRDPTATDAPGHHQQLRLLLTPTEAARALGISRATLYPLLMTREIASLKIGGSRRIPLAALEHYIEEQLNQVGHTACVGEGQRDDAGQRTARRR